MILVDADIMIDAMRGQKSALDWFRSNTEPIALSGYTAMELVADCRTNEEIRTVEKVLNGCTVYWLSEQSSALALEMFKQIHTKNGIDTMDIFTAYVALQQHLPLHTFNHKHFKAIPNLTTIQPYKK